MAVKPLMSEVGDDFEAPQATAPGKQAEAPKPPSLFSGVSAKTAARAKQGNTSSSRTGKAKQATFSFSKPNRTTYVKTHPSPDYSMTNVPVYENKVTDTWHFITPALIESDELPERFQRAIKLIDIFAAGNADGSFFLWTVPVTGHSSRKGALKAIEAARSRYVIVEWMPQGATYTIEPATEAIPEPNWASLPSLESMMIDAFDSTVSVADDKVVKDFMSGGVAYRKDLEDEE